jgi:hypothetical protein
MKPLILPAAALIALALAAAPAAAQMYGGGGYTQSRDYTNTRAMTPEQKAAAEKNKKLAAWQKEGRKLQKEDGGTLTPEHKAYLEAKLAEINGAPTTQTAAAAPAPQAAASTPPQQ